MSFLFAIVAVSLVLMFPVLLALRKVGAPGIASFSLACILAALSAGIGLSSQIAPPLWLHMIIGWTTLIAACLMILKGFRDFLGCQTLGFGHIGAILVATAVLLTFLSYGTDNASTRIAVAAGLAASIHLLTGVTILRHWPRQRAIAPHLLFCCVIAFSVMALHCLRILALTSHIDVLDSAAAPLWTTALPAAGLLITPLFFLGIILMLQGWMIASLSQTIAHDDLTGALSRRAFMAEYDRLLNAAALSRSQTAFMLLDLDRFKQINDLHGHAGGDFALAHFTATVRHCLAGRGILGRLGGEEFGIVLSDIARHEAVDIAEAICKAVRTTPASMISDTNILLTVSIGLAMVEPGGTPSDAMIRADVALYEAKAMGRDRLCIAGSLHTASAASARALAGAAAQMRAAATGSAAQSFSEAR